MNKSLDERIQKLIINYYKCLKLHETRWHKKTEELNLLIKALINQCDQFIVVNRYNINNTEFQDFENLIDRLLLKICSGIENELVEIQILITDLNTSCQDLKNKTTALEKATLDLDWTIDSESFLIKGSALQRPLEEILEWSYQIIKFYKEIISEIFVTYKKIDYRNIESIQKFQQSFSINDDIRKIIKHSLTYLQFCEQVIIE